MTSCLLLFVTLFNIAGMAHIDKDIGYNTVEGGGEINGEVIINNKKYS